MRTSGAARFERLVTYVSGSMATIACLFMVLMAVHVVADITARYLMRQSLEGVTELASYYYMVGIIFLPLLYVRRSRGFITAEIFTAFMTPAMVRVLDALADILLAVWFLLFAWITAEVALEKTASAEFVETTVDILAVWPSRWFLPIGAGAAGIYCLIAGIAALVPGAAGRIGK